MNKNVLITGASSGLGMEFAKLFAAEGDNVILVARSENKLQALADELQTEYGIVAWVCAKDLVEERGAQEVYDFTRDRGIAVDILINNAGFGDFGAFATRDRRKQYEMVQLNVAALVQLTHCFLGDMISQGSGRILNVASIASFLSGPLMSVYYATKAFVLSFSESLSLELKGTGVTVTALCPGPTDTGFEKAADLETSGLFARMKVASARDVVEYGRKALALGKVIAIHGVQNKLAVTAAKFAPRALVRRAVYLIQK